MCLLDESLHIHRAGHAALDGAGAIPAGDTEFVVIHQSTTTEVVSSLRSLWNNGSLGTLAKLAP